MDIDELKRMAAEAAVEQVRSGMTLGLGTGSTTRHAVAKIGELLDRGELSEVVGIATSEQTAAQARQLGIRLTTLMDHPRVDLAIDGADEVAPNLDLIKGLGGALLREKQVELAADRFVVIVDESKLVDQLGTLSPVPVEVALDGWSDELDWLAQLGCRPEVRGGEYDAYVTDNGNAIIDCHFSGGIDDPRKLAEQMDQRTGVLAHGLFLDMADEVIIARPAGIGRLIRPTTAS